MLSISNIRLKYLTHVVDCTEDEIIKSLILILSSMQALMVISKIQFWAEYEWDYSEYLVHYYTHLQSITQGQITVFIDAFDSLIWCGFCRLFFQKS